jgi:hypothetical protein
MLSGVKTGPHEKANRVGRRTVMTRTKDPMTESAGGMLSMLSGMATGIDPQNSEQ